MHPYSQSIEPTATQTGEFTDGNPQLNRARTILRSYWPNMIQRELLGILSAAGITPEQENYGQIKQAIQSLINTGDAAVLTAATNQNTTLNTNLRAYIDAQIAAAVAQATAENNTKGFIGQISFGPYTALPAGHFWLDGTYIHSLTYPALFNYIYANYAYLSAPNPDYPGRFALTPDYWNGGYYIYLPNMSGLFVRGTGGNANAVGQKQDDAIRNITGFFEVPDGYDYDNSGAFVQNSGGAFSAGSRNQGGISQRRVDNDHDSSVSQRISFNASGSVTTADENRPVNVAWRYLIRAY